MNPLALKPFCPIWEITVSREDDGRYVADWRSADGTDAGMSDYAATPVGALANLAATLIKVAEDKSKEQKA